MSPGELSRIFLPLTQANDEIQPVHGGEGPGLALVWEPARQGGGEVEVASEPWILDRAAPGLRQGLMGIAPGSGLAGCTVPSTAVRCPMARSKASPRTPARYRPGDFELKVKRSRAGLGLFTGRAIPEGACIIEYVGPILFEDEWYDTNSRYLFAISEQETIDGSARSNLARYINHSCGPNCEPEVYRKRVFIRALRSIEAGEELTYDYGREYVEEFIAPQGC
ncbi:MAG TPA: SET domain-containing protein-lysine N-methyltransferase, partial [Deltaproteobacteria bacterium]|nr:SET domain-containing protein-lysine N-methyltransferase [Deltaproteobacteria bacterium]